MKGIYSLFTIWIFIISIFITDAQEYRALKPDGPYIIYQNNNLGRFITVKENGTILDSLVTSRYYRKFIVSSSNYEYDFPVELHGFQRENCILDSSAKIFVISDPHADFDSFISILKGGKVINNDLKWSYSKNHLLIIGDVFDRGDDATTIFWLIYKLEKEAIEAGGCVHFLIGNHESMVLQNNLKYTSEKYKLLAKKLNVKYNYLWGRSSELGKWLRTKNSVQIIGKTMFVHGGISKELLESGANLDEINRIISENIDLSKDFLSKTGGKAELCLGRSGPLWYRGMATKDKDYSEFSEETLNKILSKFKINRIIVGHTTFNHVVSRYSGRVISIDVNNRKKIGKHLGNAIEIQGDKYKII